MPLAAADATFGSWRDEHDWTAAHGLPAHVTVRIPVPPNVDVLPEAVSPVVREHLPITVRLSRLEDRPGALVVLAEPDDGLRRLTAAFDDVLPSLPPHRGARPDLAYHATVVRTRSPGVRLAAAEEIAPLLPLEESADELLLFEWRGRESLRVVWRTSVRLVHLKM